MIGKFKKHDDTCVWTYNFSVTRNNIIQWSISLFVKFFYFNLDVFVLENQVYTCLRAFECKYEIYMERK